MLKSLSVQDLNETGLMNVGLYGPTWCVYLCELFCFYIGNDFSSMVQTKKYQYYYYCFCQNHSWETTTRAEFSLSFHSIQILTYNLMYNRTQMCWFILKRNLWFGPIFSKWMFVLKVYLVISSRCLLQNFVTRWTYGSARGGAKY